MIVARTLSMGKLYRWSFHHIVWLTVLMGTLTYLYSIHIIQFSIPWVAVSVIGTAVAFYVGFKNNQSYDRLWEARKIWGGIVNDSRTWGIMVNNYLPASQTENIKEIKKKLIYRHIAWLYQHRSQLLIPTSWEHVTQKGPIGKTAEIYRRRFGLGLITDDPKYSDINNFLSDKELSALESAKNKATQLINTQARELRELNENGLLNDFRHVEMVRILQSFYTLQGRNERIKKFPFPRQYANMSRYFVGIFVAIYPFSLIPEILDMGGWGVWVATPVAVLIGYVYVMMEIIGDYSENPFQGMANDIPMLALSRTIEIDLRQMLSEKDLPPSVEAKNGVLM